MEEILLFVGIVGTVFIIVLVFGLWQIVKTNSILQAFLETAGFGLLLYMITGVTWIFGIASDGFSQGFGMIYHGVAFLISCVVTFLAMYSLTGTSFNEIFCRNVFFRDGGEK